MMPLPIVLIKKKANLSLPRMMHSFDFSKLGKSIDYITPYG